MMICSALNRFPAISCLLPKTENPNIQLGLVLGGKVNGLNPFYDLQIWITREYQGRVVGPAERVDRKTAIQMLTRWASEYVLREDVLGSLEQGKWADLIVLDKDYLTIPEDQIKDIDVLLTLVAGKPVYVSSSFQAQVAPLGN